MSEHLISLEEARENLLACATWLAEDVKSADGHAEALKAVVPLYLERKEVDLAAELANTIDDPFTRDRLLSHVAEKCAQIDDEEYAFQLAEAIEDVGIQTETFQLIGLWQAASGDFEKALESAETLEHPDNIYGEIAVRMFEKGELEQSEEMLGRIEDGGVRVNVFSTMAEKAVEKGQKKQAAELLERAAAIIAEVGYETEEIELLTRLGNQFTDSGRKDRAIETLDKARQSAENIDSVHREKLLSGISLGFFKAGSVDLADRTLDLIEDKTHISATLLGFARGFWERDEKPDAFDALDESYQILKSQHEKETRDSRAKFQLWRTVAVQFAGFGKYERALETAQEIILENERTEAFSQIAQIAVLQKDDESAEQALRTLEEDSQRVFALVGMASAKDRSGMREEAVKLLDDAELLAETVPQMALRVNAYLEIARLLFEWDEKPRARAVAQTALETVAQIKDESIRAVTLANLADFYEKSGFELSEAEKGIVQTFLRKT